MVHGHCQVLFRAGIFKKSMVARNRGGIGLSYRPAKLHRLAEFTPWNQFLGPHKHLKIRAQASWQAEKLWHPWTTVMASCPSLLWPSAASPLVSSWASSPASLPVPLARFGFFQFLGEFSFCFREFYEYTVSLTAVFTPKNFEYHTKKHIFNFNKVGFKQIFFCFFCNLVFWNF